MASVHFSQEECEKLFQVPKFVLSQLEWKIGEGKDIFIFRAKVLTSDGAGLDLTGYWQKNGRHNRTCWGFSLYYLGHCVRSYDMAKTHKNPGGGGRVRGPHKHKYSSSKIDRFAYKPDPALSETDANQGLLDFLAEANIQLRQPYQSFMFP
jgi:hypothetical protein